MDSSPETEGFTEPVATHASSHDSVSAAIVSAIAEALECDLDSLDPVSEAIDLESFDRLFTSSSELRQIDLRITFTVSDCKVILYGDGRIVAVPAVDCCPDAQKEESRTTGSEGKE